MSDLLNALRTAVRPQTPQTAMTPLAPLQRGLPGAARRLSVGPWVAPGSAPDGWGALAAGCNHPHEGDAIVSIYEMYGTTPLPSSPVALLRRRMHPVQAGDVDARYLQPIALYELLSPNGRDYLSSTSMDALLEELARRIGDCYIVINDG